MLPSNGIAAGLKAARGRFHQFTRRTISGAGAGGQSHGLRRKPANLIYDVDEVPPLPIRLVLAMQHVLVISVGWIFIVVMISAIGGTPAQAQAIMRVSMIASGLATILQGRTLGPVGSGYLCPFSCGPAYLAASILAGKTGGLAFDLRTYNSGRRV